MKTNRFTAAAAIALMTASLTAQAQLYRLDPPSRVNDYISWGNFNTNGNLEGWWPHPGGAVSLAVADGVLKVTTLSPDPWFYTFGPEFQPAISNDYTFVEMRVRILEGERNQWEMFWGQEGARYFDGNRRLGFFDTGVSDSQWHIFQFDLTPVITTRLTDFRLDVGQGPGTRIEVDWIRVGKIGLDSDGDGLPDYFETETGVFVTPRDTGTSPWDPDTDFDGYTDGFEVEYGTDPNNPNDNPRPTIVSYSQNPALYIVDQTITPNEPTLANGFAIGFEISPPLPPGLNFDLATGIITGTPSAASTSTVYSVVATFDVSVTATQRITIEVRNPFIEYTVAKRSLKSNAGATPFAPTAVGPAPASYSISPPVPAGLYFAPESGQVSGTPTAYSPPTTYTVTASYGGAYPDAAATMVFSVVEDPRLTIDPAEVVEAYESVMEFTSEADLLPPVFTHDVSVAVADGIGSVSNTGDLPWIGKDFTLSKDYRVAEMRVKATNPSYNPGAPFWAFYWSENIPQRGYGHSTSPFFVFISLIPNDGNYHIYQLDFTRALEAQFNGFRFDTGYFAPGAAVEVDYIRIGSLQPVLRIRPLPTGQMRLSWRANAEGYALESTSSLPGTWEPVNAAVDVEGNENVVTYMPEGPVRFYRLVK